MGDGTGLTVALLGLRGSRVLTVPETPGEVVIDIETAADVAGLREVRDPTPMSKESHPR